jgi:rhomboid protease GluP
MFKRQRTGSVVCASCGSLVGVNDDQCYSCGRRNPGLWGFAPILRRLGNDLGFVPLIIYGCGGLYVLSLLFTLAFGRSIMGSGSPLGILAPDPAVNLMMGASGGTPVFGFGMWWTVLSAGWLHAGIIHIALNMMWVRNLGPAVADMFGGSRMVIIYTMGSIGGFVLSSVLGWYLPLPRFGAEMTVGASAPIFALLGALMHYGTRSGSSMVYAEARGYAVAMIIFGLLVPGVDNAAHAGGFAGGYLASMWLDPLKPERVNHMVGALVCLVLTLLSILASVATFLPTFLAARG